MDIAVANVVIKNIKSEKIFMDLIQKVLLQERYFMQKVREAMKSSELHKLNDSVQVDEFNIGGKEEGKQGRSYDTKKKKVLCAMELTDPRQSKALLCI